MTFNNHVVLLLLLENDDDGLHTIISVGARDHPSLPYGGIFIPMHLGLQASS